jgi:hypothetical protein
MAYSNTPKTTTRISVSSNNISNDNINVSCDSVLYKRGSRSTGLDVSSGVQRISPGQTGATTIVTASLVTADKNGSIYLKNLSDVIGEECIVTLTNGSAQTCSVGNLGPGQAMLMPYDGNCDVKVTCASNASQELEFLHIYEDTTY